MIPTEPGTYPRELVSMAEYLRAPAVSSSVLKKMDEECPAAAWFASWLNTVWSDDSDEASDNGTIAHALVLEGDDSRVRLIDPADYPSERKPYNVPVGWGNKPIRMARDRARAEGFIPVLVEQWERIKAMADSAKRFIETLRANQSDVWQAFQADGRSETTYLWRDGATLCRMRTDRESSQRDVVVDLKFTGTSAHPDTFGRAQLVRMNYALSAAFYRRGMKALHGVTPSYYFLVVEQDPPHLASLIGLDPTWLSYGEAKMKAALARWQRCHDLGEWPGYPAQACYPELPPWELKRLEEEEIERGFPYDPAVLFQKTERA